MAEISVKDIEADAAAEDGNQAVGEAAVAESAGNGDAVNPAVEVRLKELEREGRVLPADGDREKFTAKRLAKKEKKNPPRSKEERDLTRAAAKAVDDEAVGDQAVFRKVKAKKAHEVYRREAKKRADSYLEGDKWDVPGVRAYRREARAASRPVEFESSRKIMGDVYNSDPDRFKDMSAEEFKGIFDNYAGNYEEARRIGFEVEVVEAAKDTLVEALGDPDASDQDIKEDFSDAFEPAFVAVADRDDREGIDRTLRIGVLVRDSLGFEVPEEYSEIEDPDSQLRAMLDDESLSREDRRILNLQGAMNDYYRSPGSFYYGRIVTMAERAIFGSGDGSESARDKAQKIVGAFETLAQELSEKQGEAQAKAEAAIAPPEAA